MAEENVKRKLTAILYADVAGYSRLMRMDEEATIASLRACRQQVIEPKLLEYHGRIANTAGDSLLIEFQSAVDALRCAIDIQKAMAERNEGVPDEHRLARRTQDPLGRQERADPRRPRRQRHGHQALTYSLCAV